MVGFIAADGYAAGKLTKGRQYALVVAKGKAGQCNTLAALTC